MKATAAMVESLWKWRDRPAKTIADPIKNWGHSVFGDVLEVGLGMGFLAAEIASNPLVTSHTIVEVDPVFLPNAPKGSEVIVAQWPCGGLEKFDCITLDYPGFNFSHFKWCLAHLREGGAVFIRGV
jgi:hypothetical protein